MSAGNSIEQPSLCWSQGSEVLGTQGKCHAPGLMQTFQYLNNWYSHLCVCKVNAPRIACSGIFSVRLKEAINSEASGIPVQKNVAPCHGQQRLL